MQALPDGYYTWSDRDRIDWQKQRVAVEEPAYRYLENGGLWQQMQPEHIREHLEDIRKQRKRVEIMLQVTTDLEFVELQKRLKESISVAGGLMKERAVILAKQFRRKSLRDSGGEKETLDQLRQQISTIMEQAENLETEIINLCDKYQIDPAPFMKTPMMRSET